MLFIKQCTRPLLHAWLCCPAAAKGAVGPVAAAASTCSSPTVNLLLQSTNGTDATSCSCSCCYLPAAL